MIHDSTILNIGMIHRYWFMRGDNFSSCVHVVLRMSKTYAEIHGKSSPQAQNGGSKWGFFSKAGLYLSFSKAGLYRSFSKAA